MDINKMTDAEFFDFDNWIDLAPNHDWGKFLKAPEPVADDEANTIMIPEAQGVAYLIDGELVSGVVEVGDGEQEVAVVAEAASGFVLVGTRDWTLQFTGTGGAA
ncbi:hypothetical protein [Brachybacterium hainanense]|uniref:Uncharacterized protein n=1 Tax=Brachybacterium hainanense TaxID=1541174 RepID=A0ABV6RAJ8_9MICO